MAEKDPVYDPVFYSFTYEAYDPAEPDEDNYRRKNNSVDVTIMASAEALAFAKLKGLVKRETYKLTEIVELSDIYVPLKGSRF
jgi:hypothetical protein